MRRQVTIALNKTADPDPLDHVLVHRLRNFGEDLYREFSASGHAEISLEDVDSAISELHVRLEADRKLKLSDFSHLWFRPVATLTEAQDGLE